MEIGEKGLIKYANNTRARVSCLLDVNSGFILTSDRKKENKRNNLSIKPFKKFKEQI